MPQNAVIKTVGGDYATLKAWHDAEKTSDYGAPTRAYVSGVVPAGGTIGFRIAANSDWPNGAELIALSGEEFNGTNAATCARITHTAAIIDIGDADFTSIGLAYVITAGYNSKNIGLNLTKGTTVKRNLKLKNLYLESSPNYHGGTTNIDLTLGAYSSAEWDLDIENIVMLPRASNNSLKIVSSTLLNNFHGNIKNITILPTNSGSSAGTGLLLTVGAANTDLVIDGILSLGSEVRTTYKDSVIDATFGGTVSNIVTKDATGTITGKTTTSELENYAAGDYRLKKSGQQYGAFKQSGTSSQAVTVADMQQATNLIAATVTATMQAVATSVQQALNTTTVDISVHQHLVTLATQQNNNLASASIVTTNAIVPQVIEQKLNTAPAAIIAQQSLSVGAVQHSAEFVLVEISQESGNTQLITVVRTEHFVQNDEVAISVGSRVAVLPLQHVTELAPVTPALHQQIAVAIIQQLTELGVSPENMADRLDVNKITVTMINTELTFKDVSTTFKIQII